MATQFKIERGVPLPDRKRNIYPFDDMLAGDSFEVPLNGEPRHTIRGRINGLLASQRAKGRAFATRSTDNGIRVWRLS